MTDRQPYFQILRTEAGWHTRLLGGNSEPVTSTEVYTDPTTAEHAIVVMAKAFGITLDHPRRSQVEFGGGWASGMFRDRTPVRVYVQWRDTDTAPDRPRRIGELPPDMVPDTSTCARRDEETR